MGLIILNSDGLRDWIPCCKHQFAVPCTFRYGDHVTATIWISNVGVKSCTWMYEFHNQKNELLWSSEQVTVCVSMKNMESLPIPSDYARAWRVVSVSDDFSIRMNGDDGLAHQLFIRTKARQKGTQDDCNFANYGSHIDDFGRLGRFQKFNG